jgi:electron transfer flavoprotein beta subunit
VAVVKRVEVDGDAIVVDRELEGGLIEVVRIGTPALLTVQTGINEPRYATLRAIKQARDKPLELVRLADLGLDEQAVVHAGSRVRRLGRLERGAGAEMLAGSPAELAARIADIVKDRVNA